MSMNRMAVAPPPAKVRRNRPPSSGSSSRSNAAANASPAATPSPSLSSRTPTPAPSWFSRTLSSESAPPGGTSAGQHWHGGQRRRQVLIGESGVDHLPAEILLVRGEVEQAMAAERSDDHLVL